MRSRRRVGNRSNGRRRRSTPLLLATRSAPATKPPSVPELVMTQSTSSTPSTPALRDALLDASRLVTCPLCHTRHAWLTREALQTAEGWRCVRCRQHWDARRLTTVAAYAAWIAEDESVPRKVPPLNQIGRASCREGG